MLIDHRRLVTAGKRLPRVAGGLYLLVVALGSIAHLVTKGAPVPMPDRLAPAAVGA
jgi:hypothetical protein